MFKRSFIMVLALFMSTFGLSACGGSDGGGKGGKGDNGGKDPVSLTQVQKDIVVKILTETIGDIVGGDEGSEEGSLTMANFITRDIDDNSTCTVSGTYVLTGTQEGLDEEAKTINGDTDVEIVFTDCAEVEDDDPLVASGTIAHTGSIDMDLNDGISGTITAKYNGTFTLSGAGLEEEVSCLVNITTDAEADGTSAVLESTGFLCGVAAAVTENIDFDEED